MRSLLAVSLLVALTAHAGNQEMEKALARINASTEAADALAPFLYIMAHASEAPALQLFVASTVAMGNERLADAGFLFYAAQLRARFDLARYPPKGTGGNSPAALLGALNQQIGEAVNPAIMRDPVAFEKAVKRVAAYAPATPADYSPGWEFATTDPAAATKLFTEQAAEFARTMGGIATLLSDPQYFAAFKTLQDFNFNPDPKGLKAKNAAEAKMLAIEKKRGIEGLYYKK